MVGLYIDIHIHICRTNGTSNFALIGATLLWTHGYVCIVPNPKLSKDENRPSYPCHIVTQMVYIHAHAHTNRPCNLRTTPPEPLPLPVRAKQMEQLRLQGLGLVCWASYQLWSLGSKLQPKPHQGWAPGFLAQASWTQGKPWGMTELQKQVLPAEVLG